MSGQSAFERLVRFAVVEVAHLITPQHAQRGSKTFLMQPTDDRQRGLQQTRAAQAAGGQHVHCWTWAITPISGALRQTKRRHGPEQTVDARMLHAKETRQFATADGAVSAAERMQHLQAVAKRLVRLDRKSVV